MYKTEPIKVLQTKMMRGLAIHVLINQITKPPHNYSLLIIQKYRNYPTSHHVGLCFLLEKVFILQYPIVVRLLGVVVV